MSYVIADVGALAFFIGFVALTKYEHNRGTRFFEHTRLALDHTAERAVFVWTHIAAAAFIHDFVRNMFERVMHYTATEALRITQFAEQKLTRIVYTLRSRFTSRASQSSQKTSPFIQKITDFKQELRKDGRAEHR